MEEQGLGNVKGGAWLARLGKPGNKKRRRGRRAGSGTLAPADIPPFSKGPQEQQMQMQWASRREYWVYISLTCVDSGTGNRKYSFSDECKR